MKCDEESFRDLTESNPRYLVTPSDTPAICHSGTRANALHIAAQSGILTYEQGGISFFRGGSPLWKPTKLILPSGRKKTLFIGFLILPTNANNNMNQNNAANSV